MDDAAAALLPAFVDNPPAGIVFTLAPAVLEVTLTITVQPPVGMALPLAMVKLVAPAVAVTPVQVPVLPAVLIVIPAGNVSVKTALNVVVAALLLPNVRVKLVLPPTAKLVAALVLAMVGALNAVTVSGALAAVPVVATGPAAVGAAVVLVTLPGVDEVTVIAIWQLTPGLSVATFSRALASPTALAALLVLVSVPQEAGVKVAVVLASVSPAGKVSGNCTVVIAPGLPAGLVNVNVSVAFVPGTILAGAMVFVAVAGA